MLCWLAGKYIAVTLLSLLSKISVDGCDGALSSKTIAFASKFLSRKCLPGTN